VKVSSKQEAATAMVQIENKLVLFHFQREGFSRFNKIYEYGYNIFGQDCTMTMTSVSGHLLNFEFAGLYKRW
jgi:DNA topoisomerase-3